MTQELPLEPEAGPSTNRLVPGASPYHESSQFRNWRYSSEQLAHVRNELNAKSMEVVARNQELERKAQAELNHKPPAPPPPITYLSTSDELLLLRFYCHQISLICQNGFGLPEVVEATAISYLKRFYLKNSVMEWHPKVIMPTCLFLAAKTTNYPVLIEHFIPRFAKLKPADVLDTEFLVAQSLRFEFWVRGAEKAARGWFLEMQECPSTSIPALQSALPRALHNLAKSRLTDAEFIYAPSQIALACWRLAAPDLVAQFLDWRYAGSGDDASGSSNGPAEGPQKQEGGGDGTKMVYGMQREVLEGIVKEIETLVQAVPERAKARAAAKGGSKGDDAGEKGKRESDEAEIEIHLDRDELSAVDKRLKRCTNPEKTPGTALYIQRKRQKEAEEASAKTAKSLKAARDLADRNMVFGFGDVIPAGSASGVSSGGGTPTLLSHAGQAQVEQMGKRRPLSPRITVPSPDGQGRSPRIDAGKGRSKLGVGAGGDVAEEPGMGLKDEAMGMTVGGRGLKEVGTGLEEGTASRQDD